MREKNNLGWRRTPILSFPLSLPSLFTLWLFSFPPSRGRSVRMWKVSGSEVLMQLLSGELCFDIHELPPLLSSPLLFPSLSHPTYSSFSTSPPLPYLTFCFHLLIICLLLLANSDAAPSLPPFLFLSLIFLPQFLINYLPEG